MIIKINRSDVIWSYFGTIFKFGMSIITLPMILSKLPKEEVGVWYGFSAMVGIMLLLDMGMSHTFTRNFNYSYGGARTLLKEGISNEIINKSSPNYELMYQLIVVCKKIYRFLSIIAIIFLLTIGSIYVFTIAKDLIIINEILIAWLIYSFASVFNFYFSYLNALLNGMGKIREANIANTASNIIYLLCVIVGLIIGKGLLALSIATLINGIANRVIALKFVYKELNRNEEKNISKRITKEETKKLINIVKNNAIKMGTVSIGTYLITTSTTLICSLFIDLDTTASYSLSLQLFSLLATFSAIFFNTRLPMINQSRIANDNRALKEHLSISLFIAWTSFIIGGIGIIFFAPILIEITSKSTNLLPRSYLTIMFIYQFLEFNHGSIFGTFITSKNQIPFAKPAIISGIFIVIISIIAVKYCNMGILGIMLSRLFVQLAYNNWKWPLVVSKEMNIKITDLFINGFKIVITSYKDRNFIY